MALAATTALVTGGNRGLGLELATHLVRGGARVLVTSRRPGLGEWARASLISLVPGATVDVVELDLSDRASIESAVERVSALVDRLDVLVANAAVLQVAAPPVASGIDRHMAVNHLGHMALTAGLLPLLWRAPAGRVVTVTSRAHRFGRIDLERLGPAGRTTPLRAYAASKLANVLFARELDRRLRAIGAPLSSVAVNPGGDGIAHPVDGARAMLAAATAPWVTGGALVAPAGHLEIAGDPTLVAPSARAQEPDLAAALWDRSVTAIGRRPDL